MGLRAQLLSVVLADLPTQSSTLDASSPRWDELLGGKKSAGVWGRFSTGYGTTCVVVLDGWMISAGFPSDMVIAVDTPSGGGTKILQALYAGATSRGWMQEPVRGSLPSLRPGDIYVSNHTTSTGDDGTHIGVITAVRPAADGQSMEVDTADGGQGTRDHQSAGRRTRTFKLSSGSHPVLIETPNVGESWLERWVAVGGDEPLGGAPADEDSGGGPGGASSDAGSSGSGGAAVLLGAVGLLCLAGGWYYFASESKPKGMNAVNATMRAEDAVAGLAQTIDEMYAGRASRNDVTRAVIVLMRASSQHAQDAVTRLAQTIDEMYAGRATRNDVTRALVQADSAARGAQSAFTPTDATVNLAPTGDIERDYASRRRFEELLAKASIETTGSGMALGDGKSLGADVDVHCAGTCDEDKLHDLARRAGTSVLDLSYWKG